MQAPQSGQSHAVREPRIGRGHGRAMTREDTGAGAVGGAAVGAVIALPLVGGPDADVSAALALLVPLLLTGLGTVTGAVLAYFLSKRMRRAQ
ncbi:MAG: hypothetical protein GVY13_18880 [Alphaproteobacteria bacterium]|jgi:hypothetical protein|nr:hypothetical protein [Alphaproteobacteria bacterium]